MTMTHESRPQTGTARGADRRTTNCTPRPWSTAYPTLTEATVRERVTDADIRTLARALDRGAFRGDHGATGFVCPNCERWAAEVTSPSLWYCSACQRAGTRYGLVQLVLADAFAAVTVATGGGS